VENKAARILVTSCKGGVGKSTVCANLALALSLCGRKVLAVDMDIGNRALDLILGVEDAAFFSIEDVCAGSIGVDRAVISARENLLFISSPRRYRGSITKEKLKNAIDEASEVFSPDFILFDTSGGAGLSAELAACASDSALIITTQNPASVRAAEKTGEILDEYGIKEQSLIINCFDAKSRDRAGIIEIIDYSKTKIAGVIPFDEKMAAASEKGLLAAEIKRSPASLSFANTAARLCGENIPLLNKVRGIRHRHKVLIRR